MSSRTHGPPHISETLSGVTHWAQCVSFGFKVDCISPPPELILPSCWSTLNPRTAILLFGEFLSLKFDIEPFSYKSKGTLIKSCKGRGERTRLNHSLIHFSSFMMLTLTSWRMYLIKLFCIPTKTIRKIVFRKITTSQRFSFGAITFFSTPSMAVEYNDIYIR
jgi:hypothetical protein